MIEHFDVSLSQFEADMHARKADVRPISGSHSGGRSGGVGAISSESLIALLPLAAARVVGRRRAIRTPMRGVS
jgi:hypothetical protein